MKIVLGTNPEKNSEVMHRRALLRSLPGALLIGSAGCLSLGTPEVRMDSGVGVLHPTSELYIANGLQPDGKNRLFVTAEAASAPDRIGPDLPPSHSIANRLRTPESGGFYIITQLRSTPAGPISLSPAAGSSFEWKNRSTLRADVVVEPWGSLDRISDEELRERLATAEELVYTSVWRLVPGVQEVPDEVELVLTPR